MWHILLGLLQFLVAVELLWCLDCCVDSKMGKEFKSAESVAYERSQSERRHLSMIAPLRR